MRRATRAACALAVSCLAWCGDLSAQEPKPGKAGGAADARAVRPIRLDVLSLQVSKLPRDQFGHGTKPGTKENVAFWLANTGTAVDLRIKLDRPVARFNEAASRLVRFADDRDGDLTRLPDGEEINTFFPDNKPIVVKPGPGADEAEIILRAPGTPKPGSTRINVQADLVFVAGSDERTAEARDLDPTPGNRATIGPLSLQFKDPKDLPEIARRFQRRLGGGPGRAVTFAYEPVEKPIRSLICVGTDGEPAATLEGIGFQGNKGGSVWFTAPDAKGLHLRVVYFEKSGEITVPIRVETGVGF
jgi:hypothetical protein